MSVTDFLGRVLDDFKEPFLEKQGNSDSWRKIETKTRYFKSYSKENYRDFLHHFSVFLRCHRNSNNNEQNSCKIENASRNVKNAFHSLVHSIPPSEIEHFNKTQRELSGFLNSQTVDVSDNNLPRPYGSHECELDHWKFY